jgi:hypothetical protein
MNHITRAATDVEHIAVAPRDIGIEQIQQRPGARRKPPVLIFGQFGNAGFVRSDGKFSL